MAKKFKDKDGNVYIQQKPFYKRVWFWVVMGLLVCFVGATMSNNNDSSSNQQSASSSTSSSEAATADSSSAASSSSTKKQNKTTASKIGQTASYNGFKVKVNSVKYSDGDEYDKPDSGKHYVIINITITNGTSSSVDYNPYDFKLNADGNKTDLDAYYSVSNELDSGSLDKGASVTGNLVGEAKTNASKLLLEYQDSYDETLLKLNLKK